MSVLLAGPVSWLVRVLAGAGHLPAAATDRVFVGAVDALVFAVAAFAVFAFAGRSGSLGSHVFAAVIGYLLGQAGYLGMGWLVDGGTASLASVDPALFVIEAGASMLGAAGAVGVWSGRRGTGELPRE